MGLREYIKSSFSDLKLTFTMFCSLKILGVYYIAYKYCVMKFRFSLAEV